MIISADDRDDNDSGVFLTPENFGRDAEIILLCITLQKIEQHTLINGANVA